MNKSVPNIISAAAFADAMALFATIFGAPLDERDIDALLLPIDRGALAPLARVAILRPDIEGMASIIRGLGNAESTVSRLNRDFCLLFLGTGGPGAAPFESAYLGTGRLFQEPAGEMAALLQQCGRKLASDFPEAPDHLSVELSLLEETLHQAAASGDPDTVAAADALVTRLRGWVPQFAAACREQDGTGFYAGAAMLLDRLLKEGNGHPGRNGITPRGVASPLTPQEEDNTK